MIVVRLVWVVTVVAGCTGSVVPPPFDAPTGFDALAVVESGGPDALSDLAADRTMVDQPVADEAARDASLDVVSGDVGDARDASGVEAGGDAASGDVGSDVPVDAPRCGSDASTMCSGRCVDTSTDDSNCGACSHYCQSPHERCVGGACVCPAGWTRCAGSGCVDLRVDARFCGACGVCCSGGACAAGVCISGQVRTNCPGASCVDLDTDRAHCGACGAACAGGMECVGGRCACPAARPNACAGVCTDVSLDGRNCGACGVTCTGACVAGSCATVTGVAATGGSRGFACAVAGGAVLCWGDNSNGQLGAERSAEACSDLYCSRRPVPVPGLSSVASVAVGSHHACALKTDGTVWCWGSGQAGALGYTPSRCEPFNCLSATPTRVPELTSVGQIALGQSFSCALKTDGTVWCWGRADLKQVGSFVPPEALCPNGSLTISCLRTPTIVPGLTGVASLAVGSSHVCALKTDGTVWCWGNNEFGQLGAAVGTVCRPSGYGPVPCVETPTRVAGLPDAAGIAAIGGNTCALMRDGTARCWGDGLSGQLGSMVTGRCDNPCMDTHCTPTPTEVPGLSGLRGLTLSLDNQGTRACAWRADGTVSCWGAYDSGFFGGAPGVACSLESRCTHGERPCTPTPLTAPGLTNVEMLTRGCALTRTGGVLCWGDNFSGQLGDGTVTHRRTPAPVVF